MVEECFCCGAFAPSWETGEYGEWWLELTPEGVHLGVICPGCFAGEGLAFLDVEVPRAVLVALRGNAGPGASGGTRLAEAA
ncbi:MAG TPA: hypothetical protein VNV44_10880 [Solirubrobacteraceae bacterium]|jgi:hypothetical protein|nr:hypothetical protein [Solirubrobacteraceae bacterium]